MSPNAIASRPPTAQPHGSRVRPSATRMALLLPWIALAAVYVFWGTTYAAMSVDRRHFPITVFMGARFTIAGVLLLGAVRLWKGTLGTVTRRHLTTAAITGCALLAIANTGIPFAEERISSGLAAVIVAMAPLVFVVMDRVFRGVHTPRIAIVGLLCGILGILILAAPTGGARVDLVGIAIVLCGTLFWTGGSLYGASAPTPSDPLVFSGLQMLSAGLVLSIAGLVSGGWGELRLSRLDGTPGFAFGWLIVFGSIAGFTAYSYVFRVLPLATVSTYAYVNPVVAILVGWFFLGEGVSARMLISSAVILASVALVIWSRSRAPAAVEVPPAVAPGERDPVPVR
jgi:drug/metabolite transporter (DMT)-like permease